MIEQLLPILNVIKSILIMFSIPILFISLLVIAIYLVYRYGGEFSTKIAYAYNRTYYSIYHFFIGFNGLFILILLLSYKNIRFGNFFALFETFKTEPISNINAILSQMTNVELWIITVLIMDAGVIALYFKTWRTPKAHLRRRNRKEIRELFKWRTRHPNNDIKVNGMISGTTGTGKTAYILGVIEAKASKGEPILIIEGKGDIDEYSLYEGACMLAKKYNRQLYVVNQTISDDSDVYNPFIDCNATQVKDMLISMGDWSGNASHYKSKASRYWQMMAEYMINNFIPLTFENLINYSVASELASHITTNPEYDDIEDSTLSPVIRKQILDRFGERGLSKKRTRYLKIILSEGDGVEKNANTFATIYEGEGKKLFSGKKSFKMEDVLEQKGIAIILLNRMSYGDFASSLGRLAIQDIKNALGYKMMMKLKEKVTVIFEEIGTYFDEEMVDVYARVRSIGGYSVASMQGVSDIDVIDQKVRRQIVNNTNFFVAFKHNDPEDATAIADILGTDEQVTTTSQVEDLGVAHAGTGAGTNKLEREYRFNPELIKMLPTLRGIVFDKSEKYERPYVFKVKYIDRKGLEVPTKEQRERRRTQGTWS